MKRWAIRILLLSTVVGGGWITVAVAQRQWGLYDAPPPDFSKPPVNGDTTAAAQAAGVPTDRYAAAPRYDNNVVPSAAAEAPRATEKSPVDPFQGGDPSATVAPTTSEPSRLDADPRAAPMARATAAPVEHTNSLRDDFPAATETGLADTKAPARAGEPAAAADPFVAQTSAAATPKSSSPSETDPAMGNRYAPGGTSHVPSTRSGNSDNIVPTAGIVAATGAVEALKSNPSSPSTSAPETGMGGRYQSPSDSGTASNYRQPSAGSPTAGGLNNDRAAQSLQRSSAPGGTSDENLLRPAAVSQTNDAPSALLARNMPNTTMAGTSADSASTPVNVEGMGRPGDKKLEGTQSPSVTLEKTAPPEIQVGKAAKFEIMVRNVGQVEAADVQVIDAVPQGTQLLGTTPKATVGPRGEIVWKLGDMRSGAESKLEVEVMPLTEGEIGSVAVVQFRSTASVRTVATKPELVLDINAPKQVMIGGDAVMNIKLSNPGTGAANKVVLSEKVPSGFQHPAGAELEFEVGTLKPGETRQLDLTLHAVQAGKFTNNLVVQGDANLRTEQNAMIEVIAPALGVALNGPGLRYLDRQAKYTVSVTNPGTAVAKDVELITHLPQGMQFVEATDSGHYDANSHSVIWSLAELPPGQTGSVTLTTLAKEAGEQKFRTEGHATGGLSDVNEQVTNVEGVAAVLFTVADVDDPVEVNGQATYEIHVVNQGSKAANHVQIGALLPNEMKPTSAEGPAKYSIDGQRVVFEPLARLAPKADVTYRVVGQCLAPGDLRIKVQLQSEEMAQPVTKEESTRVYKD